MSTPFDSPFRDFPLPYVLSSSTSSISATPVSGRDRGALDKSCGGETLASGMNGTSPGLAPMCRSATGNFRERDAHPDGSHHPAHRSVLGHVRLHPPVGRPCRRMPFLAGIVGTPTVGKEAVRLLARGSNPANWSKKKRHEAGGVFGATPGCHSG